MSEGYWTYGPRVTTITIVEKEREQKPVLYDAKGRPLVKGPAPIGFRPPKPKP